MFKIFLLFIAFGFSAVVVEAKAAEFILIDGSVARCEDMSNHGSRAFRIKTKDMTQDTIKFTLENLVCVESKGKMIHVPYALSRPFVYHKDGRVLSYEYTKANIVILNNEATAIYQTVVINSDLESQEFVVNTKSQGVSSFDVGLQSLEIIKLDGHIFDQGMVFSGSYRVKLK